MPPSKKMLRPPLIIMALYKRNFKRTKKSTFFPASEENHTCIQTATYIKTKITSSYLYPNCWQEALMENKLLCKGFSNKTKSSKKSHFANEANYVRQFLIQNIWEWCHWNLK